MIMTGLNLILYETVEVVADDRGEEIHDILTWKPCPVLFTWKESVSDGEVAPELHDAINT